MSGTSDGTGAEDVALQKILAVFNRVAKVDALPALIAAVGAGRDQKNLSIKLIDAAIAIDSSVFLRLGSSSKGADIIDYLNGQHVGPLVLPGQAIQEFWNNQLAAVETLGAGFKKKLFALKTDTEKIDASFGEYGKKLEQVITDFQTEFGYVYEESTVKSTTTLLQLLHSKNALCYAPRSPFHHIAEHRKRTKTPPGFEDKGDGDFYVWLDLLFALVKAQANGSAIEHVVIVTNDQKPDWSRNGIAHPVLTAEVNALLGATLHIWNLDQLHGAIKHADQSPEASSQKDAVAKAVPEAVHAHMKVMEVPHEDRPST